MGKESLNGQMELSIQVIGRRTQQMGMENTTGLIEDVTWENGEIINFMERVCIHGQMDDHTMGHTLMIRSKDGENISGLKSKESLVKDMQAFGLMVNNMVKESLLTLKARAVLGYGLMVSVIAGWIKKSKKFNKENWLKKYQISEISEVEITLYLNRLCILTKTILLLHRQIQIYCYLNILCLS